MNEQDRAHLTGPVWEPLLRHVAEADMSSWMWMSREQIWGVKVIEQYKHATTRRYVNLDHSGRAWRVTTLFGRRTFVPTRTAAELAWAAGSDSP